MRRNIEIFIKIGGEEVTAWNPFFIAQDSDGTMNAVNHQFSVRDKNAKFV